MPDAATHNGPPMSTRHPAEITEFVLDRLPAQGGGSACLRVTLAVNDPIMFDFDCSLEWFAAGAESAVSTRHLGRDGMDVSWLPAGRYEVSCHTPRLRLAAGEYRLVATIYQHFRGTAEALDRREIQVEVRGDAVSGESSMAWELVSLDPRLEIEQLSWRRGHEDWFFRHFDHAARTIISYMLGDSPLLAGRILDVGCGDGITDLGVCLRFRPQEMVGIDPFEVYRRLPEIMAASHIPAEALPSNLRFEPADANELPFPDDSFDVVISWGSLEHIAGGYLKALEEIRRVLKDDGLLFVHPGLYYSNFGHHLGEFCNEPHFHLTKSQDEIREIVFGTEPRYMDRSGEFSSPEQYWRWYNELNPMTVAGFEKELRSLGFEFYRAALRTEDRIEYHHPSLQQYSLQDLATVELYLSAWNRKKTADAP